MSRQPLRTASPKNNQSQAQLQPRRLQHSQFRSRSQQQIQSRAFRRPTTKTNKQPRSRRPTCLLHPKPCRKKWKLNSQKTERPTRTTAPPASTTFVPLSNQPLRAVKYETGSAVPAKQQLRRNQLAIRGSKTISRTSRAADDRTLLSLTSHESSREPPQEQQRPARQFPPGTPAGA